MNTSRQCADCGEPLATEATAELCPQCQARTVRDEPQGGGGSENARGPARKRAAPPSPAEIGRHFPQLEVIELIGQGGMGIVYKARQTKLDRFVALKILTAEAGQDPTFAERFGREAKVLARLNHPGIVGIYDFGQAGPFYYLVMEFVDGADVRQLIAARKIAPHEVLNLVTQICDALQFAHSQGVVHRDIKPSNILVDRTGRVKIADFGLAKLLGQEAEDAALTGTHHVMGTPQYMAPEQREQSKTVDHRADIYSLGVVFYEMLTGDLPVGRFAPPSAKVRVDVRLDEVVLRTLEHEPERRYQRASEIRDRVDDIAATPVPDAPLPPPRAPKSWSPKGGLWVGAAVVILVLGSVAAAWLSRAGGQAVFRETPPKFGHATPDSRWFSYRLELAANHRLTLWIEWWEGGRPTNRADFAIRDVVATARGLPFQGQTDLILWQAPRVADKSTNRVKWQWGLRGGNVASDRSEYARDPFAGLPVRDSSYGHSPVHKLRAGKTRTLAVLRGGRERLEGQPWDPQLAGRAEVEMHLKARLEPVPENELSDVPTCGPPGGRP